MIGSVIAKKTVIGLAPRSSAASSIDLSISSSRERTSIVT